MKISFASLLLSICALFIALGALLITTLTLPSKDLLTGLILLLIIVGLIGWFIHKYGGAPDFSK
jgi:predicted MFS family arabinose efflux permease